MYRLLNALLLRVHISSWVLFIWSGVCVVPQQGYTLVTIRRSDMPDGQVGFSPANSTIVASDEDAGLPAMLTIERQGAWYGGVSVDWRVFRDERFEPSQQLQSTGGNVYCGAGHRYCTFSIYQWDDDIPENETWYMVTLVSVDSEDAQLDTDRLTANVTLTQSDHPNGMVQFEENSRYSIQAQTVICIPGHLFSLKM